MIPKATSPRSPFDLAASCRSKFPQPEVTQTKYANINGGELREPGPPLPALIPLPLQQGRLPGQAGLWVRCSPWTG